MIQVEKINNQLSVTYGNNVRYYMFSDIKSINPLMDSIYGASVVINFINENRDSALVLKLSEVDNQAFWTNDASGLSTAVNDISSWVNSSSLNGQPRRAIMVRLEDSSTTVSIDVYSLSIANVGSANAVLTSFDFSETTLKPGEIMNFDAGSVNNYFDFSNSPITIDASTYHTDVLITYVINA